MRVVTRIWPGKRADLASRLHASYDGVEGIDPL
jgi:hypothetical protein